ncbi:PEP-CTERM/exosortase system-associated acyltransferase [Methylomonas albis]|uniref:PEP-CTERM/exosortase system-associated acyltransferase n=1 Tax=Methylomonas albis TaxID=1854563 RepID=A0ABR9D762_9GAMM|nr:PEP-CTERM/exosortase system-associated acyltransferase [Methylomonas albis]MBD9357742.1 PEP-CTERM/exosortase system-associated acyltransferase [Methylomonas albis]
MISDKQTFDSCFEVFLADTPESKQLHYNLRYQVYCEERGFEDKDKFPQQMELDKWDDNSVHFLVRHIKSGYWLGGLRLVFPINSLLPFEEWSEPYQKICPKDRNVSVEMSRLCIIKEAKRFASMRFAPPNLQGAENGNVRSLYDFKNQNRSLMWGLIRAACLYSAERNIVDWYFVVAPALASILGKGGLDLARIGDSCEHRGLRIPYRLTVDNVLGNPLWAMDYKRGFRRYSDLIEVPASRLQRA